MEREKDNRIERDKNYNRQNGLKTPIKPEKNGERENKMQSEEAPHHLTHQRREEDLYQPKVMRNSSSHYDHLIQQLQQSPPDVTAKSYASKPRTREQKSEINYLVHPQNPKQIIAYCIVLKQSHSGIISHERFLVVDSHNKTVQYYSSVPAIPLKTIEDIVGTPKEIIELRKVKKFQIVLGKRGIGQLDFSWVDAGANKQWRIRTANSAMAKELATVIEQVRLGRQSQEGFRSIEQQRQREKSSLKNSTMSPNSKNLQISQFSTNVKRSQVSSGSKNTHFANMLLKSMVQSPGDVKVSELRDPKGLEPREIKGLEPREIKGLEPREVKQQKEREVKMEKEREAKLLKEKEIKVQKENNIKVQKEKEVKMQEPREVRMDKIKKVKQVQVSKEEEVAKQQENPGVLPLYKIDPSIQLQGLSGQIQKKVEMDTKVNNKPLQSGLVVFGEKQGSSSKSLKIEQIIKDASIQRIQYITLNRDDKKKNVNISHLLNSPKQAPVKSIEKVSGAQNLPLHKLEERDKTKISVDLLKAPSPSSSSISKSKVLVFNPKIQSSVDKKQSSLTQIVNVNQNHTLHHHHRQHLLLDSRKYSNQATPNRKDATLLSPHSHRRRENSQTSSLLLDQYISRKTQTKNWLERWVTAKTSESRADLYVKFIEECKRRVKRLTDSFENWHLFHKEGQKYAVREDEIELTYFMGTTKTEECLEDKMQTLKVLWTSVSELNSKEQSDLFSVSLACLITFKGLTILCKAPISLSTLHYQQVSDLSPYSVELQKLQLSCQLQVSNPLLFKIHLNGKPSLLYLQDADLKLTISQSPPLQINQVYLNNFVKGVIRDESHLEQIKQHIVRDVAEGVRKKLAQEYPVSYLELLDMISPFGVNLSILPLLYNPHTPSSHLKRLILSELAAQVMFAKLTKLIHQHLISKLSLKALDDKIYELIAAVLRLDSTQICQELMNTKQVQVTLSELKQLIIDEYVVTSLLLRAGLKCSAIKSTKLEGVETLYQMFWRQIEINQLNFQFCFQPTVNHYQAKTFNYHYEWLKKYVLNSREGQDIDKYSLSIVYKKIGIQTDRPYYESPSFLLLSVTEKQQFKYYLSQRGATPITPLHPTWEQQNSSPYFHLFHFQNHYFITQSSFQMINEGIWRLIEKKLYTKADSFIRAHLQRCWVWGKNNPNLLMKIEDLASLVNLFQGNQIECLQNCLMSLQISIKAYEDYEIEAPVVLEKAFKASFIHRSSHRYSKALELMSTAQSIYLQLIESPNLKDFPLISRFLCILSNKAQLLLLRNAIKQAEEHLKMSLGVLFKLKEYFSGKVESALNDIFQEEFQIYSLLFRTYELLGNHQEMLILMEICSVKFVQNYLELTNKQTQHFDLKTMSSRFGRYLKQTLKNVWIAVLMNILRKRQIGLTKMIELQQVRHRLLQMRRIKKQTLSLNEQTFDGLSQILRQQLDKRRLRLQLAQKPSKSALVSIVVASLIFLSEADLNNGDKVSEQGENIVFVENIISCLGYEFMIGAIDSLIMGSQLEA